MKHRNEKIIQDVRRRTGSFNKAASMDAPAAPTGLWHCKVSFSSRVNWAELQKTGAKQGKVVRGN